MVKDEERTNVEVNRYRGKEREKDFTGPFQMDITPIEEFASLVYESAISFTQNVGKTTKFL